MSEKVDEGLLKFIRLIFRSKKGHRFSHFPVKISTPETLINFINLFRQAI